MAPCPSVRRAKNKKYPKALPVFDVEPVEKMNYSVCIQQPGKSHLSRGGVKYESIYNSTESIEDIRNRFKAANHGALITIDSWITGRTYRRRDRKG